MARPRNTPEVPANMMNLIPVPAESRTKKEMSLKHYAVFHWFTTPDELRRLADEMEEHWLTCAPGQDKTVKTICGKNELLHIIVDQDNIKSPGWYARKKQC